MFLAANAGQAERLATLVRSLRPDEIQLNTPLRPSPVAPLQPAAMALVVKAFEGLPARQVYALPPQAERRREHVRPALCPM
jgi:hypothetical protein